MSREELMKAEPAIVLGGFVLGVGLSMFGLSGDEFGRVNILYLLLIFAVVPVASMCFSLTSLLSGKGLNFARLLSGLPSKHLQRALGKVRYGSPVMEKYWFFLQSQLAALAYAFGGLLVFFTLLLVTDLHFVWRSTLLTPEQVQPVLSFFAKPWWFWEAAQPTQAWLSATRDSRLLQTYASSYDFSVWWPFVVAVQIFYAVLLRGCLYLLFRMLLSSKLISPGSDDLKSAGFQRSSAKKTAVNLAPILTHLPNEVTVINWGQFSEAVMEQVHMPAKCLTVLSVHAGSKETALQDAQSQKDPLVLVKAWEPPLGELADFLSESRGCLVPIDVTEQQVAAPGKVHLSEWRRFAASVSGWQIYQPEEWKDDEAWSSL